jgi:type VI secretion system protein ImpG
MSDAVLRYYQEEMRYLHEAGEQFAKSHPDEGKLLSVGGLTDRDPYVERLFEGFAFLTARIRERLDDEMPQYTDGLLGLLWPHLLRPVPSLSVVEFRPTPGLVSTTTRIPRGSEVRSAPVGEENTVCRFVTTQDVRLQPLHLTDVKLAWPNSVSTTLTMSLRLDRGVDFAKLAASPLRIYVHADKAAASLMYLFLTRHVSRVRITPQGAAGGGTAIELPGQQWVVPAGFNGDEGLLPYSPHTFHGFRLLQEYFAFRQKFWFVDLVGLERLPATPAMSGFEVELVFDRQFPEATPIKTENLRLFCSPVVNLFAHDAVPLHVDHRASEYRVITDLRHQKDVDVYDVKRVSAEQDGSRRRYDYAPYLATGRDGPRERWFTTTRRTVGGRPETFVTLGGVRADDLRPETISRELQCTNGGLPQERLREGMIRETGPDVPRVASLEMLVRPTASLRPPVNEHQSFYWRLMSHLSLAHRSVFSREGLVDLLTLYNWSDDAANRRRIAGIRDVKWQAKDVVSRRACVRGAEVVVEIQDDHFADEGDVCLFGAVLSHVFRSYATINSFVHLAIVLVPSQARYEWKPDRGALPLS